MLEPGVLDSASGRMAKLVDANWTVHYTKANRYSKNGVTYHVIDYARTTERRALTIIDVGCSTGAAAKAMKKRLGKLGIASHVLGVDLDRRVEKKARRNLDGFLLADITDLDPNDLAPADVVICSFTAIWVLGPTRYNILRSCVQFMKEDGVLLTNAGRYGRADYPEARNTIRYWLETLRYLPNGWNHFKSELDGRLAEHRKRGCFAIHGRTQALDFVESIPASWERLSARSKAIWNWKIFLRAMDVYLWRLIKSWYSKVRRV